MLIVKTQIYKINHYFDSVAKFQEYIVRKRSKSVIRSKVKRKVIKLKILVDVKA